MGLLNFKVWVPGCPQCLGHWQCWSRKLQGWSTCMGNATDEHTHTRLDQHDEGEREGKSLFSVVWVVEPQKDGHHVVWAEHIQAGHVVNDDGVSNSSVELGEILDLPQKTHKESES